MRPGEKLYEELLADSEQTRETPHPKLRIARSHMVAPDFLPVLTTWLETPKPMPDDAVRQALLRWVPEYSPMGGRPALKVVAGAEDAATIRQA